ncbi:MAG: hypothetical protein ABF876_04970 [Acetobacter aceti]
MNILVSNLSAIPSDSPGPGLMAALCFPGFEKPDADSVSDGMVADENARTPCGLKRRGQPGLRACGTAQLHVRTIPDAKNPRLHKRNPGQTFTGLSAQGKQQIDCHFAFCRIP